MTDRDRMDDEARLRAALSDRAGQGTVDVEALSRRVQTRLTGESPRRSFGRAGPVWLVGAYAGTAVLCLALGWQGGAVLAPDPLLDLALGSMEGLLQ